MMALPGAGRATNLGDFCGNRKGEGRGFGYGYPSAIFVEEQTGSVMIKQISFKNYKIFKNWQTLEIRPITIVMGKNNTGKSALLRLPIMLEKGLQGKTDEALDYIGSSFSDLLYGRAKLGGLDMKVEGTENRLAFRIDFIEGRQEIMEYEWNGHSLDMRQTPFHGLVPPPKQFDDLAYRCVHINAFRNPPARIRPYPKTRPETVGLAGEAVYDLLALDSKSTERKLLQKVADFYRENFDGWEVDINWDRSPYYEIELVRGALRINFEDVGMGIAYALPLVASALMPSEQNMLYIIEEPELHLHPAAHGNLAQLFAQTTTETNKHYLIETHSNHFILRLRRLVAEKKLSPDDIVLYYVDFDPERNESELKKMLIDEQGQTLDQEGNPYWPQGIFSEALDEVIAIRNVQIEKDRQHAG
jgi:predicted ATPase